MTRTEPARRVVVTGLGFITPCGLTVESFWTAVLAGRSTAGFLQRFDTSQLQSKLACEVTGFQPADYMSPLKAKRYDPSITFAVAAANLAVKDAGLALDQMDPDRVGVVEGTSVSGIQTTIETALGYAANGMKAIIPTRQVNAFAGGGASEIAIELGVAGQATTICTACSAGNDALGYAARAITDDLADVMVAGASEAPIVPPYFALFSRSGAMSRQTDPATAVRPFDRRRDGFVIGEGAVFLVLEELGHALGRGARIYCEWLGHGQSCDSHSMVAIHESGRGYSRAMERALYQANLPAATIDYVNAHASATEKNDVIETNSIKKVFGHRAKTLSVSGTKPVTGHLMGAIAAVEAAICALTVYHQIIPPTANLEEPEEGCDLDYVRDGARPYPVRAALNLNMGFGGKASAVILGRYPLL